MDKDEVLTWLKRGGPRRMSREWLATATRRSRHILRISEQNGRDLLVVVEADRLALGVS